MGQFGAHALRRLSQSRQERRFTLVDPIWANLGQAKGPNRTLEQGDGAAFLARHLHGEDEPDWIIPALPVHLAAEWCLLRLGSERIRRLDLPCEVDPLLPNPMRGAGGDIYVSHATFKCPSDCAEPRHICTVTQEPRKRNMFEHLGDVRLPGFRSLVIRSRQLGPGIGGYRPRQLFDLLKQVKHAETSVLLSTACRCHGVVTGIHPEKS